MEDAEEAFPLCSAQTGSAGADGVYKNEIKQMRKREAAAERASLEGNIWIKRQPKKKLINKSVIIHYLCKGYLKKELPLQLCYDHKCTVQMHLYIRDDRFIIDQFGHQNKLSLNCLHFKASSQKRALSHRFSSLST